MQIYLSSSTEIVLVEGGGPKVVCASALPDPKQYGQTEKLKWADRKNWILYEISQKNKY